MAYITNSSGQQAYKTKKTNADGTTSDAYIIGGRTYDSAEGGVDNLSQGNFSVVDSSGRVWNNNANVSPAVQAGLAAGEQNFTQGMSGLRGLFEELTAKPSYQPIDQTQYTEQALTYPQAQEYARQLLSPQYERAARSTALQAQQNLDRAGLADSLYGQALSAQAAQQSASDLESAIAQYAPNIVANSQNWAQGLLSLAQDDAQFAANNRLNTLTSGANILLDGISAATDQMRSVADINLAAEAQAVDREAQALENQYRAGLITAQALENQLTQLQLRAADAAYGSRGNGYRGGGSGGGGSTVAPAPTGSTQADSYAQIVSRAQDRQRNAGAASGNTDAAIIDSVFVEADRAGLSEEDTIRILTEGLGYSADAIRSRL